MEFVRTTAHGIVFRISAACLHFRNKCRSHSKNMLYRLTIYRQVANAVKLNGVLSCRGRYAPCARDHTHGFNWNDWMRHARRSLRSLSRIMFDCKSYPFVLSFATLTRTKLRWSQLRLNGSVFYASRTLRFPRRSVAYALCLWGRIAVASLRWLMQTEFARPHTVWGKMVLRDRIRES